MTASETEFTCLSDVDLFADLTSQEMESLQQRVPGRRFQRGELVFSQQEPVNALFVLRSGRVRIFRLV
ncbi:cyclic nucleotide-binding domain-containing protein [Nesterenkonia sphaerica]|uniref:cyclic nucleotide-binding domain-containing protein n=1 Tax=Nesterenkonia sphaerica TaxID=1804988 RepID=UPI001AA0269A|nr:cyclic nucleotide-binding domain-containing protein [Nesterenkonia sphaerica]